MSKEKKDRWKEEPRLVKIRNGVTLATRREKLLFGVEGIRQDKALAEREGSRGQDGGTDGGETEASGGREDMIQKRRKGELKSKRDREYFGLSWCLRGKEPTCQCRRQRRIMLNPWVRKFPWRRKWQPPPSPVFLPGKPHGQRSLADYGPRSGKSQM